MLALGVSRLLPPLAGLALAAFAPLRVAAFQVDDPMHANCHERMVASVLARVGYRGGSAREPTGEEVLFIRRQQLDTSPYPRNMEAIALILGVRFSDVGGLPDADLDALAAWHNDDAGQEAHCLRRLADDGAAGDEAALGRCRRFIENEVALALGGLDAQGTASPTEEVPVFIPFVGRISWPLSRFYFRAGRALHALQDSFAHTYRDPTWHRVHAVFNWVDAVRGDLSEARDGHAHESLLDDCDGARPWREAQLAAAAEASEALYAMLVTADPAAPEVTQAALGELADTWLVYAPGCGAENAYCGNEVHADLTLNGLSDGVSAVGCTAAGGAQGWASIALVLAALAMRRRHRAHVLALALVAAWPGPVGAAHLPAAAASEEDAAIDDTRAGRALEIQGLLRGGVSVSDPGWAVAAGLVLGWRHLELEAGAEWNPWFSEERGEMFPGSLNVYGLAAFRWNVSPIVDIRTGVGGGLAILLFETVGTRAGNMGPLLLVRPLGVTLRIGAGVALTVDAFELAVPMPQTRGVPFSHPQYRLAVGLRF